MSASADPLLPKASKPKEPFKVQTSCPTNILCNPLAWLLWALDFLIWVVTIVGPIGWIRSFFRAKGSIQMEDGSWRRTCSSKGLFEPPSAFPTVFDSLSETVRVRGKSRCLGTRTYLGEHKPPGAKFPVKLFGETTWTTFAEFGVKYNAFGAGLVQLGMLPAPEGVDLQQCSGPHTLLMYEETCAAWPVVLFGAFSQSIAVATSYATLGISAVGEAINETLAASIVCNVKDVPKLAEFCATKCPSLKIIIYTTNNSLENKPEENQAMKRFKVFSMDEVVAAGSAVDVLVAHPPKPEQLAVIMYTSGSTGKPKGVMITHKSIASSANALAYMFKEDYGMGSDSTYLAYLPAAHILELCAEVALLNIGCAVGYACPKTISSKGACRQLPDGTINVKGEYPHPAGGIQEFQPNMMVAVPKIWDIMKKGVEDVLGGASPLKQMLFQIAYTARSNAVRQGRDTPLFNLLVFKKVKEMLGGRMKVAVSGGGPISADVHNFITVVFGFPLCQGYALTETTCAGTLQSLWDRRTGVVGFPKPCVEIKVQSCVNASGDPEVIDRIGKPYLSSDTSHLGTPCKGRGEIMIRGPSLSSGYFKQQEKTDEVFEKDGWFHTGDIGLITPDGSIMIVDRLKNLVKLKGGEYIAIESMEKEYSTSSYVNGVNGGILCFGDGEMDRPVALVQANVGELRKWAMESGISISEGDKGDELCSNGKVNEMVLKSLIQAGKAGGLSSNEMLCAIALIPGTGPTEGEATASSPWTSENGGLTASNKLNRKPILKSCKPILDPMMKQAIR